MMAADMDRRKQQRPYTGPEKRWVFGMRDESAIARAQARDDKRDTAITACMEAHVCEVNASTEGDGIVFCGYPLDDDGLCEVHQ